MIRPVHFLRTNGYVRRSVLVLALIVGIFAIVGVVGLPSAKATTPASNSSAAPFEINFMESMSDHHLSAVKADSLCLQRATHEALRSMCASDMKSQQKEINQMVTWLKNWYGINYQPKVSMSGEAMLSYISQLHGKAFEIGFMENLTTHHIQAIMMAQPCPSRASHQSLKEMCEDIISSQKMEINQLQNWLCQWYDICNR